MEEEEEYVPFFDLASLLPFSRDLEERDPNIIQIPKAYGGSLGKGAFDKEWKTKLTS